MKTDKQLKKDVIEELDRHADLDARRIEVDTSDGKVTLHGTVVSSGEKDEAGSVVSSAPGVTTTDNQIAVVH